MLQILYARDRLVTKVSTGCAMQDGKHFVIQEDRANNRRVVKLVNQICIFLKEKGNKCEITDGIDQR